MAFENRFLLCFQRWCSFALTFIPIEFYRFTVGWWDRNTCARRRLRNMDEKPTHFFSSFFFSIFLFQIVHEKFLHLMLSNLHILCGQKSRSDQSRPAAHAFVICITNISVFFFGHWISWAYSLVLFFRLFREIRFRSLKMSSFMSRTLAHTHSHV